MIIAALLSTAALVSTGDEAAVSLGRINKAGQKSTYEVKSHLTIESRRPPLLSWMVEGYDLNYTFTTEVLKEGVDGIVTMKYSRPTMTEIIGETADEPQKTNIEKANMLLEIELSPINELLKVKDLSPKKPEGGGGALVLRSMSSAPAGQGLMGFLGPYIQEIYRLALFAGSLDSTLDFAPKLPFEEVKVGDTWKRTVGYSPQKLKSTGKMVSQRLDYTYSYKGVMEVDGKKYERVNATLEHDTDLAQLVHEMTGLNSTQTGLKEIKLHIKADIDFNLDPVSKRTVSATANSEGGFSVVITQGDRAVEEQRFKGRTRLRLTSLK